jgi:hypothetical protein
MDFKRLLKEQAISRYDQNYSKVEKLFDHNLTSMNSLDFLKFEILNCIILDYNNASITLTNHFVERMLKLSLIELETKNINYLEPEKYTKKINHAHQQYDHLDLHATLKNNKNKNLISDEEFKYLNETARAFRDSYSHAQIGKINKSQPEKFSGQMFNISHIKEKLIDGRSDFVSTKIEIPSISPSIAQLYQNISSRDNALDYFSRVFWILVNIEKRIAES